MNRFYTIEINKDFEKNLKQLEETLSPSESVVSTAIAKNLFVVTVRKEERVDVAHRNLLLEEMGKKVKV